MARISSQGAAIWLVLKMAADLAVAVGGSRVLKATGHQGVVLYLHVTLLGYVTTVSAWYLARRAGSRTTTALLIHHIGTAVMLAGLALASFAAQAGMWVAAPGGSSRLARRIGMGDPGLACGQS